MDKKELIKLLYENSITPELINDILVDEWIINIYSYSDFFEINEDDEDESSNELGRKELKDKFNEILTKHNIPEFILKEQVGGSGQGDDYYIIIYFPKLDIYLRSDAWYASYQGVSEFEEWYSVKPKEQVIIVYEKEK